MVQQTSSPDPRLEIVERFFAGTGPSYDHIVRICTLGIDGIWKQRILDRLSQPSRVLDLACGTGILTFAIARKYPQCRVVGVELREEYLSIAKRRAEVQQINNVEFILSRAEDLVLEDSFDCITSSYLAKYADLKRLVAKLYRILEKDGLMLFHDFTYPTNPVWAGCFEIYFKFLQRVGVKKYPQWQNIFSDLPNLIRRTRWVEDLKTEMQANGMRSIQLDYQIFRASAIITARK